MFFIISWRWVVNVVADMRMIRTTVTIWVLRGSGLSPAPTKYEESGAPKTVDPSAERASSLVIRPIGCCFSDAILGSAWSKRKRAKKTGDCSRIGRQDENGLVPVRL